MKYISELKREPAEGDNIFYESEDEVKQRLEFYESLERAKRILAIVWKELTERQRKVLELHYIKELPLSQIAKEMKLSYETVRAHHQRALKKLRALLT